MSIGEKIGKYVRYQRNKKGYSINQFSKMIGVNTAYLLRLEKGVYEDIKLSSIFKICQVLKMNLIDFLIKCQIIEKEKIKLPSLDFYFKEKFQFPEKAIGDLRLFIKFLEEKYKKEIEKMKKMHRDFWKKNTLGS